MIKIKKIKADFKNNFNFINNLMPTKIIIIRWTFNKILKIKGISNFKIKFSKKNKRRNHLAKVKKSNRKKLGVQVPKIMWIKFKAMERIWIQVIWIRKKKG